MKLKELPILFSTEMVQAILDGRKTQTRRTFKHDVSYIENPQFGYSAFTKAGFISARGYFNYTNSDGNQIRRYGEKFYKSPYGKAGDLLWVRETFAYSDGIEPHGAEYIYKADLSGDIARRSYSMGFDIDELDQLKFKPSIHMPKDAARIWLQVTEVKVERLHEIIEEDAKAEGVEMKEVRSGFVWKCYKNTAGIRKDLLYCDNHKSSFRSLWESINGPESWDTNPWVWVVKFEVLSTTGKPCN